jgi:hypothetical protein
MKVTRDDLRQVDDEPPPLLGTWSRVYTFVICELACVIALLWRFTIAFRP